MQMQEKKLQRFNVYKKFANVLFVFTVAVGVLVFLATLAGSIFLTVQNIDITGLMYDIIKNFAPEIPIGVTEVFEFTHAMLFVAVFHIGLSFALTAYIIKSVAIMFSNTYRDKTPFTDSTVKCLKSMGIALLVYAGIQLVISILSGTVLPHPAGMTFDANIDAVSIFFGIIILALGEIFEFGKGLQKDSESIV